jgi:2-oxoglutarate/2-oxoacid ferredoxin oxidoreductase subunit alpha
MRRFTEGVSIVLGGSAGQGIQTVEGMLVSVLKREGYRVFACKEYMSRIRGGSNSTEIRIGNDAPSAYVKRIDFLFALDGDILKHLESRLDDDTIVLGERERVCHDAKRCPVIDVPFGRFATELGNPIYTSTVAVGIVLGLLGIGKEVLGEYIREHFSRKGEDIVAKNIEAAGKGYDFGKHMAYDEGVEVSFGRDESVKEALLLSGDQALGLGALAAGCDYISSYPMSPGTGLLAFLAQYGKDFGVVVDQAEDEIAAINHALGAWYAGARAIVTTSGGGFDLMTEAVSLAGMIETPIVVHIGQRPGPSTGLPTRTEQADLNLALYAGHGEFPRAIFAPGTGQEAFMLMQQAFDIADRYQVPVFILSDQYFLDSLTSLSENSLEIRPVERHIVETEPEYKRYALTESGISPRGIPGYGTGLVGVDSDEHDETAHITEDAAVRVTMHEKRLRKIIGLRTDAIKPSVFGDISRAETVVVSWGSNRGVLEESLRILGHEDVAGLHFSQVYPLAKQGLKLLSGKHVIVLENNAGGQFAQVLKSEYGLSAVDTILQYDGSPFAIEDVVTNIKDMLI